jgi:uncharacterized membrane protein
LKPSTPWIVALLASVLLNGVLAGFVLHRTTEGPDWRQEREDGDGDRRHRGPPPAGFDLRNLLFSLPEDARRQARERARDNIDEIHALFDEGRQARDAFEAAVSADPLDREAAEQALQRLRAVREQLELGLQGVVLDLMADLDVQTRAEVLAASRDRDRHGRRHGRRDRREDRRDGPPDALRPD